MNLKTQISPQMNATQMNLNTSIESRQDAKHAKKTASKAEMAGGYGFLPPAKYRPSMDIVAPAHPPIALGAMVFSWRAWRLGEGKSLYIRAHSRSFADATAFSQ